MGSGALHPRQVALRCLIVPASAQGQTGAVFAEQLSANHNTANLWRKRFSELRLDGLEKIAPGCGRN
jgi:DNA-binding IscR family transcriptional regulator